MSSERDANAATNLSPSIVLRKINQAGVKAIFLVQMTGDVLVAIISITLGVCNAIAAILQETSDFLMYHPITISTHISFI